MKITFQDNNLVGWRQFSNVTGLMAELALYAWAFSYLDIFGTCYLSLVLGIAHFYTMEIDFKYVLGVRPYAYLPFPLALIGLGYMAYKQQNGYA